MIGMRKRQLDTMYIAKLPASGAMVIKWAISEERNMRNYGVMALINVIDKAMSQLGLPAPGIRV